MSEQQSSIDVLARRLDQALPPGTSSLPPQTADPLVNTAAEIARLRLPALSPEASAAIRTQMLAAYDQHASLTIVARRRRVRQPITTALRWGLVASLLLVVLLVGTAPTVGASLPGEILYPVKRFYETVELAAATTSSAKAAVHVNQAERRSEEALRLLERGNFDADLISAAVDSINAAALAENAVSTSPNLRGQLLEVETTLALVLESAGTSGLAEPETLNRLSQLVSELGNSNMLLPSPTAPPAETALSPVSTSTQMPLQTGIPTTSPTQVTLTIVPTCDSPGQSCQSQGVPGGQVVPLVTNTSRPTHTPRPSDTPQPTDTPRPTNTHRPSHTPRPTLTPRPTNTHRPTNLPPIVPENPGNSGGQGEGNPGGNPNNGQGNGNNPGGNSNNGQGASGNPGNSGGQGEGNPGGNPNNGQGASGNPGNSGGQGEGNPNDGQGNSGNSGNGQGGGNSP